MFGNKNNPPKLKPGMVIRTIQGNWVLIVDRSVGYFVALVDGKIELHNLSADWSLIPEAIQEVYSWCTGFPEHHQLLGLLQHGKTISLLVWERPEDIREMTVDEISKELGYKVKVVGEQK